MKKTMIMQALNELMKSITHDKHCGIDDDEIAHVVKELDTMNCGMSNEELKKAVAQFDKLPIDKKSEIISAFADRKLYTEQLCQRYGISRMTLCRWQQMGKLPPFRHESGGKSYLFMSEADKAVNDYEKEKDI